jgi:hypothetical protein
MGNGCVPIYNLLEDVATAGEARYSAGRFPPAAKPFEDMTTNPDLHDFPTPAAYDHLD